MTALFGSADDERDRFDEWPESPIRVRTSPLGGLPETFRSDAEHYRLERHTRDRQWRDEELSAPDRYIRLAELWQQQIQALESKHGSQAAKDYERRMSPYAKILTRSENLGLTAQEMQQAVDDFDAATSVEEQTAILQRLPGNLDKAAGREALSDRVVSVDWQDRYERLLD